MSILTTFFGGGRNIVTQTAGIFAPNREAEAQRAADAQAAALAQYAAEFHARAERTWLDVLADGLNRLVRPLVTLGLFVPLVLTVHNPRAMAEVWAALSTMPQGYWAVVGLVLPFYFGGRMQVKALQAGQFRAAAAAVAALAPQSQDATEHNAALEDWRAGRG